MAFAVRRIRPRRDRRPNVSDTLQISDSARIAGQMSEIPAIRQDRVDAIRTAIAQGTYETDAKLNVALDRLLDEIG